MKKKGISPVVATALFLIVTVVAIVGFSQFLNSFESEILSDIEKQESLNDIIIRDVVGSIAYIEAQKAINLSSVKIQGRDCSLSPQLSKGINKIDLGSCVGNLSTNQPELTLVSNIGVNSKKIFLEQRGIPVFIKDFENDFAGIVQGTFHGLALLSTGEIAVSGFDESASQERFIVMKLDAQGNKLWQYSHNSGATGISESSDDVIEHSDGSIIASGRIYNGSDEEMFAVKLNSDTGAEIWNYSSTEGTNYRVGNIIELADGNLALVGNGDFTDRDIYLVKIDKDTGTEIWSTQYENSGSEFNVGLVELSNGSILVAGRATISDSDQLFWLFDENGTYVLNKSQDSGLGSDQLLSILTANDGNLLVTGVIEVNDLFIQKITPDLVNVWNVTYDFGFGSDFGFGLDEFDNGDIVVSGSMTDASSDSIALLLRVNSTGSEIFNVTFTDNSASFNQFRSYPFVTADGGIVAAGQGHNGSRPYSVIVKTDANGVSCSTNLSAGCFSYR